MEWIVLNVVCSSRKANVSSEKNDEVKGGRESSRQAGQNRNLLASRLAHARTIAVVLSVRQRKAAFFLKTCENIQQMISFIGWSNPWPKITAIIGSMVPIERPIPLTSLQQFHFPILNSFLPTRSFCKEKQ